MIENSVYMTEKFYIYQWEW